MIIKTCNAVSMNNRLYPCRFPQIKPVFMNGKALNALVAQLLIIRKNLFLIRWRFAVEGLEISIFETKRIRAQSSCLVAPGLQQTLQLQNLLKISKPAVTHGMKTLSPEVVCCQGCWGNRGAPCDTRR